MQNKKMVHKCIVRGCRSEWYPGCHVKFHLFPKDFTRRNIWLSIVPLKRQFYESGKICSLHFKQTDYSGKRLTQSAKPFFVENTATPGLTEQLMDVEESTVHAVSPLIPVTSASTSTYNRIPIQCDEIEVPVTDSTVPCTSSSFISIPVASQSDIQDKSMPFTDIKSNTNEEPSDTEILDRQFCVKKTKRKTDQLLAPLHDISQIRNIPCAMEMLQERCSMSQVADENIPLCKEKSIQVKMKTDREVRLLKRNKVLRQNLKRKNMSIDNMKTLLAVIKNYTARSEIENIIKGNFSDICKLFKKPATRPQGMRYCDDVKAFALTLHFYSSKAYDFIRKYVSLPHPETLRRSLASFNCNVGFLKEVFEYLKLEVHEKVYLKNVALIFDGMSLKQGLAYDQKQDKVFGYVDLGQILIDGPEQLASEALVFQIVSYTNYFKCPIGYFFIQNSLSGELLAELLKTAIIMLSEIGITVRSLTSDGAPSNIKAYKNLGCSLDQMDFKPYFNHPNGRDRIYCLLDPAHMLKLARNILADFTITSTTGNTSFEFIKKLHEVQKAEGLKFGNKLSSLHVDFKNKKMNVKLAAQVLSSSVADAIDFLRISGNPKFKNSEATVEYLRIIDRLFDLMNTKSPFGKSYKSPLSLKNKSYWERIFNESKEYLLSLSINGKNILRHGRNTFALGFLMNITSFSLLVSDLCTLQENPLKYFLTFKCSQDNLEIFFSCIRARGRTQNNPTPLEFRNIMRKMLFRNSIQPSLSANCIDHTFESTHIFEYNKKHESLFETTQQEPEFTKNIEEILKNLDSMETSPYQENILYYITGYIIKQMVGRFTCQHCRDLLLSIDDPEKDHLYSINLNKYHSFTAFINRGKLCFPSVAAYNVVKYTDKVFKRTAAMGHLNTCNIKNKLITMVLQYFTPMLRQMFDHPITNSLCCSDLHESKLVKHITNSFLNMRMRSQLKSQIESELGHLQGKRQKLHKTVIFSHI